MEWSDHIEGVGNIEDIVNEVDAFANSLEDHARQLVRRQHSMNFDEVYADSITSVALAAYVGQLDVLRDLIAKGRSVNQPDNRGWIPLHHSAVYGRVECVKLLLEQDVTDPNCVTFENETALFLTCEYGSSVDVVKCLAEHEGVDVNKATSSKRTPLHAAARSQNLNFVKVLVEHGAQINAKDVSGTTALHTAAESNLVDIVKYLLDNEADPRVRDDYNRTPLFRAAARGSLEAVSLLLEKGSEVDASSVDGATPLLLACQGGHISCVKMLLEHGANVNHTTEDHVMPLHSAAEKGHSETVRLLLSLMDYQIIRDLYASTQCVSLVCLAISGGSKECLQLLLNSKLDMDILEAPVWEEYQLTLQLVHEDTTQLYYYDALTYKKKPPLSFLFMDCEENVVDEYFDTLIQRGFSVNATCEGSFPPLTAAVFMTEEYKLKRYVQCLIDKGADVDYRTKSSEFPGPDVMAVACISCPEALEILLPYTRFSHVDIIRWCCQDIHKFLHLNTQLVPYLELLLGTALKILGQYGANVAYSDVSHLEGVLKIKPQAWKNVHSAIDKPSTLQQLCRLEIRNCIKQNLEETASFSSSVEKLNIPQTIKQYILYKHK